MKRHVMIRLLSLVPLWLAISVLAFALSNLAPGDPAIVLAQRLSDVPPSEEQIAVMRRKYQLDDALPLRYLRWLAAAARGDLGLSYRTKEPVLYELTGRLPATLMIACAALLVALALSLPFGVIAAVRRNRWQDHAARAGALLGASLPSYWLAYLLILVFALGAGWLPVAGREGAGAMVLPSLTLGFGAAAGLLRLTRSSLLEILGEDYIRTARAKGLSERVVVWRHALRGALIPVVTMIGITFGHLLGGAVIVEQIFAWPGVGSLLVESIYDRDYPVIQGFVLFMGTVFMLLSFIADVSYMWIDPRIRLARERNR